MTAPGMVMTIGILLIALWSFTKAPSDHETFTFDARGMSTLSFGTVEVPTEVATRDQLQTSSVVTRVDPPKRQSLSFMPLMRTGMVDNGEIYGGLKDQNDQPILHADGTPFVCNGTNGISGSGLDFVSILNDPDGSGKLYMVSQFECSIGAYYVNELQQDAAGRLQPVKDTLRYISQKAYHGGWVHCAGSKTPWESHLGSEEYEPDGRIIETYRDEQGKTGFDGFDAVAPFFGGDMKAANPYYWGWMTEVQIEEGDPSYRKHYAMGRFSHELGYVMPDGRTVYMSDDGTNVGFYMFVADHAANLHSGTLYAARWKQTASHGGGRADLEWINLGHSCHGSVKEAVDSRPDFSDLFEVAVVEGTHCPKGFSRINTVGHVECLKLKTDRYSEGVISRLETRRYAAMKGATTEFRKEEGVTFDPDRNRLYVAMSDIDHGMLDGEATFDGGGPNHIRLAKNGCGAVYALDTANSVSDSDGNLIASEYVAATMQAMVIGTPKVYDEEDALAGNECHVEGIANPDNLTYLAGANLLVIGEDSKKHRNNALWAYDVQTSGLQRIATLPEGAEATAPYWVENLHGHDYLSFVVQHPCDEHNESYVGAMGPF